MPKAKYRLEPQGGFFGGRGTFSVRWNAEGDTPPVGMTRRPGRFNYYSTNLYVGYVTRVVTARILNTSALKMNKRFPGQLEDETAESWAGRAQTAREDLRALVKNGIRLTADSKSPFDKNSYFSYKVRASGRSTRAWQRMQAQMHRTVHRIREVSP